LRGSYVEAGFVSDADTLVSLYNAADLYVTPTRNDNLPTTVMESLSCATPVLAFGVGGIPEMIQDGQTGWVLTPGDTAALIQAATTFVQMAPQERQAMGERARTFAVSQYEQSQVAERYHQLYDSLLK
jgi:glycosyltransferase involved in cell wall biosynthesis